MRDTVSLYEAKARLSAILRRVREGHSVVITVRGEPAAEIRPITQPADTLQARLRQLADRGILVRPQRAAAPLSPGAQPHRVARRPGALGRFLADRDA